MHAFRVFGVIDKRQVIRLQNEERQFDPDSHLHFWIVCIMVLQRAVNPPLLVGIGGSNPSQSTIFYCGENRLFEHLS
jgi:hypothetical protein